MTNNTPTEIANFKSKLEEFAIFADKVFQGNNESYKKELRSRVGHHFSNQINSNFNLELPRKKPRRDVKINLPDEIWIKILGFMDQKATFKSFALTCKHFNKLTLDHNINISLTLRNINSAFDYEQVMKVLKRSRKLKKIEIFNCSNFNSLISAAFMSSKMLKSIKIKDIATFEENEIISFNNMLQNSENQLEFLSINGGLKLSEATISKLYNLKVLRLSGQSPITSNALTALAKNRKIESLHTTVRYDDHMNLAFIEFFKATEKTLKDLNIENAFMTLENANWTRHLFLCQSLEKLEIKWGTSTILQGITEHSKLKVLKLIAIFDSDDDFNPQNLSNFCQSLKLDTIEELFICNINISLEDFNLLANRKSPNLNQICLFSCKNLKLDEYALKMIISNSPKLKTIHTYKTSIDLTYEQVSQLGKPSGVIIGLGLGTNQQLYQGTLCKLCGHRLK